MRQIPGIYWWYMGKMENKLEIIIMGYIGVIVFYGGEIWSKMGLYFPMN